MAGLPRVMAALQGSGFDDAALRKLSHENWLRVLGASWKEAQSVSPTANHSSASNADATPQSRPTRGLV